MFFFLSQFPLPPAHLSYSLENSLDQDIQDHNVESCGSECMSLHFHSCKCNSDIFQVDDGASSIASFEEVSSFSQKQSAPGSSCFTAVDSTESEAVPDVRYVLQYKRKGEGVECKSTSPSKIYIQC